MKLSNDSFVYLSHSSGNKELDIEIVKLARGQFLVF
jgi:hypothetical protein